MSVKERKMCVVCAWRENCNKKFSMGEGKINCPDFAEDITLKNNEENDENKVRKANIKKC